MAMRGANVLYMTLVLTAMISVGFFVFQILALFLE
jgi:hypothetical protein